MQVKVIDDLNIGRLSTRRQVLMSLHERRHQDTVVFPLFRAEALVLLARLRVTMHSRTTVGSGDCSRRVSGVKRIFGAATLLLQRHVIILQQYASLFCPLGRSRFLLHEAQ